MGVTPLLPFVLLLALPLTARARRSSDEVAHLPGIGVPSTRTLSGYACVNETEGTYLYYLFVESQGNPATVSPIIF
jgi:hypothetical protein